MGLKIYSRKNKKCWLGYNFKIRVQLLISQPMPAMSWSIASRISRLKSCWSHSGRLSHSLIMASAIMDGMYVALPKANRKAQIRISLPLGRSVMVCSFFIILLSAVCIYNVVNLILPQVCPNNHSQNLVCQGHKI